MNGSWIPHTIRQFNQKITETAAEVKNYGIAYCAGKASEDGSKFASPAYIAECLQIDTKLNPDAAWTLYHDWAQIIDLIKQRNPITFTNDDSNGRIPNLRIFNYEFQSNFEAGLAKLFRCTEHYDSIDRVTYITIRSNEERAKKIHIKWAYCPNGDPKTSDINVERRKFELTVNQDKREKLELEIARIQGYINEGIYRDLERGETEISRSLHAQYRVLTKIPGHDDKVVELLAANPALATYDRLLARIAREKIPIFLTVAKAEEKIMELERALNKLPKPTPDQALAWRKAQQSIDKTTERFKEIGINIQARD